MIHCFHSTTCITGLEGIFGQSFEETIDCISVYLTHSTHCKQSLNVRKKHFFLLKNPGFGIKASVFQTGCLLMALIFICPEQALSLGHVPQPNNLTHQ